MLHFTVQRNAGQSCGPGRAANRRGRRGYSYSQCPALSSQHSNSSPRNQSAISRRALSTESLPWITFLRRARERRVSAGGRWGVAGAGRAPLRPYLPTSTQKSPRMVPGAASAGSVAPMSAREARTTSSPCHTCARAGGTQGTGLASAPRARAPALPRPHSPWLPPAPSPCSPPAGRRRDARAARRSARAAARPRPAGGRGGDGPRAPGSPTAASRAPPPPPLPRAPSPAPASAPPA